MIRLPVPRLVRPRILRALVCSSVFIAVTAAIAAPRTILNFNPDWRFTKSDPAGAQAPAFDDASWERVSAPHTYNDVDTFDNWSLPGHRGEQQQWSGRTWYRKTFNAPAAWKGQKVFIEFEAVRQFAEVYLNGKKLGVAKGGFTPFGFDLTPHIRIGEANTLAVMADNRFQKDPIDPGMAPQAATSAATHPNLAQLQRALMEQIPEKLEDLQPDQIPWNNPHWHPAHGGIYRNVRLIVTDPLHFTLPLYSFLQTEGPYVYATNITEKSADITITAPVRNARSTGDEAIVRAEIFDADNKSVLVVEDDASIAGGADNVFTLKGTIQNPRRWEPGYPHVYRVVLTLNRMSGGVIDSTEVPLGIRSVRWDVATGFWINGQHYKLTGWGQKSTNEWPGIGAAQPDWMQFYTSKLMREAGGNFVRWGHVPGSPAQIAAGDHLGIVQLQPGVDGEHDTHRSAWELRSSVFRDLIIYYRNNPSILIWEGGNQKISREHAAELRGHMDKYDPHGGRAYAHRRADAITAEFMDVGIGTEGGREIARLPVVEGEYNREESPRRVWDNASPPNFGYPEAKGQTYQLTSEQFAVNQVSHYVNKLGPVNHAGGANWIFSDSTSGGRVGVEVARTSGEVDGVRLPKEAFYVCQVMFTYEPRVHIIGHWSYPENTKKTIYVVANTGGEVELFLNGKSLGRAKPETRFLYTFPDVAFVPGELKAVAYQDNKAAANAVKTTVGAPAAFRLTAITGPGGLNADGADFALIDVEAVDAKGQRVPTFQQRVDFALEGPGVWRGGYNSGKIDSINNTYLDLEAGVNRVAIRSTLESGPITLTVRHAQLPAAKITIESKPVAIENGMTTALPMLPSVALPATPQRPPASATPKADAANSPTPGQVGRFIKTFNYTGPGSYIAHIETNAADGRNAYVDLDSPFRALPAALVGADWSQLVNRDAVYHAVDLVEMAVNAGTTVTIAHDDRLPRPPWLAATGFTETREKITVAGQSMTLFTRSFEKESSMTFGPNTEDSSIKTANMYLIFVQKNAAK
jgi:beta-galactosidase